MKTQIKTEAEERAEKVALLEKDYQDNYAGNFYPAEFKPQGYVQECNFGGSLVILSTTGESLLCWTDWAGAAIDSKLTECNIEYGHNEEEDENTAYFEYRGAKIDLFDVMNINNL